MLSALIISAALQGGNPFRFLDRSEYASASGAWHLTVSADSRYGLGGAQYDLLREGQPVWSGHLPFALREVSISDEGLMAGHAEKRVSSERVDFLVAAVDAEGKVLFTDRDQIEFSSLYGPDSTPRAKGQLADFERGVLTVRVDEKLGFGDSPIWRRYELAGGQRLADQDPSAAMGEEGLNRPSERQAFRLPGTELRLVSWSSYAGTKIAGGEVLSKDLVSLVDDKGEIVWIMGRPEPCAPDGVTEDTWKRAVTPIAWEGMILDVQRDGTFDLWHFDEAQRVTYRATASADTSAGWVVEEIARTPKPIPIPEPRKEREKTELELIDIVHLAQGEGLSDPALLEDARAWTFGADGGFEFVRVSSDGIIEHLRVDGQGNRIDSVEIDPERAHSQLRDGNWSPLGAGKWLSCPREYGWSARFAFIVNGRTGEATQLKKYEVDSGELAGLKLARGLILSSGGSVLLHGKAERLYAREDDHLLLFGSNGKLLNRLPAKAWRDAGLERLDIEHIAVTDRGEVAYLDAGREYVVVLSTTGEELRRIDLAAVLGKDLNYPVSLRHTFGDRVLVEDFGGETSFWEVELDGSGGRPFEVMWPGRGASKKLAEESRFASDGSLWSSDGESILHLNAQGAVEERVGARASLDVLHEPGAVALLRDGRVCVRDERTGAVHVWSESGEKFFVGAVDDGDAENIPFLGELVGGPKGQVWAAATRDGGFGFSDRSRPLGYLGWSSGGERLGYRDFGGSVAFAPDGEHHWVWGRESGARLHDSACSEITAVEMHPDGRWIRSVEGVGCDPDGTVWIVDGPQDSWFGETFLLRCSSVGAVKFAAQIGKLSVLSKASVTRGEWVVTGFREAARLGPNGKVLGRYDFILHDGKSTLPLGITPDGERFLAIDTESLTLYRYDLTSLD